MGTNYYLHKKAEYKPNSDIKSVFGMSDYLYSNVQELKNGFVWHDTYYKTLKDLNKDFYQEIHIGKSSAGWHFGLCIYKSLGINTLGDWKRLFKKYDIYDEYGHKVKPGAMIATITDRKGEKNLDEDEYIAKINSISSVGFGLRYINFEDFLTRNSAQRGKNGLLKHAYGGLSIVDNETGGTYDYIDGDKCIFS